MLWFTFTASLWVISLSGRFYILSWVNIGMKRWSLLICKLSKALNLSMSFCLLLRISCIMEKSFDSFFALGYLSECIVLTVSLLWLVSRLRLLARGIDFVYSANNSTILATSACRIDSWLLIKLSALSNNNTRSTLLTSWTKHSRVLPTQFFTRFLLIECVRANSYLRIRFVMNSL